MKLRRSLPYLLAALLLLAAAAFLTLRFGWFDTATAPVILPDTTPLRPGGSGGLSDGHLTLAEVTPETVQAVIATFSRPDSYSRELRVRSLWEGGEAAWDVQVWQKYGATRIRIRSGEDEPVRNVLLLEGDVCVWYEGNDSLFLGRTEEADMADALQMIPSYEDVLALDPEQILEAAYVERGGVGCILVTAEEKPTGCLLRYYVSVETGLLEAAERLDGDELIYSMTASQADLAAPEDGYFVPGG
ncbi:MAG: hypothetical protein IKP17_08735 [Oscillospiraceae bacterium]|nr:hypothetical protein [Oscillospiraceae bacterium]